MSPVNATPAVAGSHSGVVCLPDAHRFASVSHAEFLRMFEQAGNLKTLGLGCLGSLNAPDGNVDELVTVLRPLALVGQLTRQYQGCLRFLQGCGPESFAQFARLQVPHGGMKMTMSKLPPRTWFSHSS